MDDNSYSGQLLIATPQIQEGCFRHAVVYMNAHTRDGAMGVIINHPIRDITPEEILDLSNLEDLELPEEKLNVFLGGPVETSRAFVLHSNEYVSEHTLQTPDGLCLSSNKEVVELIARDMGPRQYRLLIGYSGWGAAQLEQEVRSNSWFTAPASSKLVFETPVEQLWEKASESLGVNPLMFSDVAGSA